jgi:hypothetical protein
VTVVRDRAGIEENLSRVCNMIDFGVGYWWDLPVRLAVLPEYFLQGSPPEGSRARSFMKKAISIDGPEMQHLGESQSTNVHRRWRCHRVVPEFPDRWFNTALSSVPRARSYEIQVARARLHQWLQSARPPR